MLEVLTGSICCWGEGHSCWFEFGTKIVPSSGSTSPLQELDYSWEFGKGPQLHQGTKLFSVMDVILWFRFSHVVAIELNSCENCMMALIGAW